MHTQVQTLLLRDADPTHSDWGWGVASFKKLAKGVIQVESH